MGNQPGDHEVLTCFKTHLSPLSKNLTEMLNEHFSHQTERRGCGYTQATRVIAEFINQECDDVDVKDFRIFDDYDTKSLKSIIFDANARQIPLKSWRHLDLNEDAKQYIQAKPDDTFSHTLTKEIHFQATLRNIKNLVEFEESKLICNFLEDIILRKTDISEHLLELKSLPEKPKVGSCPMAEKFFLKVAHRRLLRQGLINIFVDDKDEPIMMEKLNMGDDHSCINLVPLIMNGIRIPEGSLFSVKYDDENIQKRANKLYKGFVIPIDQVEGFWFLRLTTLAVSPQNRARAFNAHFKQQIDNGLFSPDTTELSQLKEVALDQI
ncbi:hypothetical protein [Acinetobacter shaoyimingii]|uniref:Uncharacterized protein n=1 Tax=Acinetobacter shaoyimingii TaxID=2715164 RepID=A0A6G8RXJ0_9GAMM|nr:hypothetical protein [Acinetobacter shaoyimingii]NHB57720.1 hypothetical protein [Acinetobacter shaoyimingii]QIO06585.1 hypothetical protein G8E00_11815 [Acinetobacter shaoyimingii]